MNVRELYAILTVAMAKGCSELPVAATIDPEASTSPIDLAYGDVNMSGPNFNGRVFGITAIKGEFPEAVNGKELAEVIAETLSPEVQRKLDGWKVKRSLE